MIVVNDSYYPLVMTNIATVFRWPIEIDGLPFLKMGGSFRRELLNNQMVINKGLPSGNLGNLGHLPNMRVYHPSGSRMWRRKIHEHNPND